MGKPTFDDPYCDGVRPAFGRLRGVALRIVSEGIEP